MVRLLFIYFVLSISTGTYERCRVLSIGHSTMRLTVYADWHHFSPRWQVVSPYKRSNTAEKSPWYEVIRHDDITKWKHFPRYWPFVRGIHQSPVNSPHKGQSRGALMFSLICVWINRWVNYGEAGDLRRHRAHYDVILMECAYIDSCQFCLATAITSKWLALILSRNKRRMIQATSGARGYFIGLAWQWRRTYDMTYEA